MNAWFVVLYEFEPGGFKTTDCHVMDVFTNCDDAKEYMISSANRICLSRPGGKPAVVFEGQRFIVRSNWDGGYIELRTFPRHLFQHIREDKIN